MLGYVSTALRAPVWRCCGSSAGRRCRGRYERRTQDSIALSRARMRTRVFTTPCQGAWCRQLTKVEPLHICYTCGVCGGSAPATTGFTPGRARGWGHPLQDQAARLMHGLDRNTATHGSGWKLDGAGYLSVRHMCSSHAPYRTGKPAAQARPRWAAQTLTRRTVYAGK